MACQKCGSVRVFSINAHCSDLCNVVTNTGLEHDGYVPDNIGIGGNDDVAFDWCIDCGQIQGEFPVAFNGKFDDDEDDEDLDDEDDKEECLKYTKENGGLFNA